MTKKFLLALCIMLSATVYSQIDTPQPSPSCTITQTVGLNDIEVNYSRPGMKSRTIFGGLVPYDEIWRTGANASTKVKFGGDVKMGELAVPKGEYALYTIPGAEYWVIILNKDLSLWGTGGYDEKQDVGRIKVKPVQTQDTQETFTIDFSGMSSTGADMVLRWDRTEVKIPITTNAMEEVEAQIKSVLIDGPGAGSYYQAARFYLENDKDLKQALSWIDTAIEKRPEAFWYVHQKAKIQGKMGLKKEAIATATKSMEMAKSNEEGDYGYVKNNEELIMKLKSKGK